MFGFGKRKPQLPSKTGEPHKGLPDSTFNEGLCPYCGNQSAFQVGDSLGLDGAEYMGPNGAHTEWFDRATVLYCRHCSKGVLVVEEQYVGSHPMRGGLKESGEPYFKGKHWWPSPTLKAFPNVPPQVTDTLGEAVACNHAKCFRASVVMSRRALEAICDDQGLASGTLNNRLLALEQSGKLHPTLAQWCHEVRETGNGGAHFDPAANVAEKDATDLIGFISELLRYLYELPQELQARKNARAGTP